MEKLHTSKAFLKMAGGRMHIPHPTLLYGHKLQKLSKESGIFQFLGTIILFFLKSRVKRGGHGPM